MSLLKETSRVLLFNRLFITSRVFTHMIREVRGGSRQVVEVRLADVPLLYDQVDGHFAFEAADVPVTEVITELMNLRGKITSIQSLCLPQNNNRPVSSIIYLL